MIDRPLAGVSGWLSYLDDLIPPVLAKTGVALEALHEHEDDITGRDLSAVILHDPLMTLRVLRYLQTHHGRLQNAEVTTIAHAAMMLGTGPFFRHFAHLASIENLLDGWPAAREGLLRVLSRSRLAALFAREWSYYRKDMESDEVVIAALLRDLAEMLMWLNAPSLMLTVRAMQLKDRNLRTLDAQRAVFGFPLIDLQRAIIEAWHLPRLLIDLMDHKLLHQPRVRNVVLAVDLARHLSNGWDDAALPDDYRDIQQAFGISAHEARESIHRAALQAAHEWTWYNVTPVMAFRPASQY